jgi:murein L,D-transpeptidase YafK
MAFALMLAGCQGSLEDMVPKDTAPLPDRIVQSMKAKGMTRHSPIMVRIFKEEGELEVWKQKDTGRYDLVASYGICKWSGKLGPKFREGDRQAPEGFYTVSPAQMNPKSSYYLAFNIGYPNAYDRSHGRGGSNLMVHGACSSAGCYSMTDEQVREIYAFARDAFKGGQTAFQVQAFPFRMTAENMARYRGDPNFAFWEMLKEGYDHFEITKVPPKVDVCEGRYVFNRIEEEGAKFSPAGACPPSSQPEKLMVAYSARVSDYSVAFSQALNKRDLPPPRPSIRGIEEAILVSKWSAARARGEKVGAEPPSLSDPVSVAAVPAATTREAAADVAYQTEARKAEGAAEPAPAETVAAIGKAGEEKAGRWWNPFD